MIFKEKHSQKSSSVSAKFQDKIVAWRKSTGRRKEKRGRGRLKWRPRGKGEKEEKWEDRGEEGRGKNRREKRTKQKKENTIGEKTAVIKLHF